MNINFFNEISNIDMLSFIEISKLTWNCHFNMCFFSKLLIFEKWIMFKCNQDYRSSNFRDLIKKFNLYFDKDICY